MATAGSGAPAPERLKKRADFQACSKGRRFTTAAFVLQTAPGRTGSPARFGFTTTKKVGHATERNRMRRRLRELVRLHAGPLAETGRDYVLVAKREALAHSFSAMQADLALAMQRLHSKPNAARPAAPPLKRNPQDE